MPDEGLADHRLGRSRWLAPGATRGSHRQYRHPQKPGTVTIPGRRSDDLHPKSKASILYQARLTR
ncbi:MAG: type II toxin-antitoxin system HicA family toxin [Gaiellaceae bacterium]